MNKLSISESEIFADIRRVARRLNHSPSSVEYKQHGRYDVRTVQRRFSLCWSRIIESAGLRYTVRTSSRIPTTKELRDDLMRVARVIGHPPIRSDYEASRSFGAEIVRRRSGKKYWEDAVASLTDLSREEIKRHQCKGGCYRTTSEWLSRLLELSQKLGHAPTTRESNEGGINAHQLCLRVGGNWRDVLKAAEIDLHSRSKHAILLSTTTEALIDDVVAVSWSLGRPPKVREYAARGRYPHTAVRGRLGGWRRVKNVVSERLWAVRDREETRWQPHLSHSIRSSQKAVETFFNRTRSAQ